MDQIEHTIPVTDSKGAVIGHRAQREDERIEAELCAIYPGLRSYNETMVHDSSFGRGLGWVCTMRAVMRDETAFTYTTRGAGPGFSKHARAALREDIAEYDAFLKEVARWTAQNGFYVLGRDSAGKIVTESSIRPAVYTSQELQAKYPTFLDYTEHVAESGDYTITATMRDGTVYARTIPMESALTMSADTYYPARDAVLAEIRAHNG